MSKEYNFNGEDSAPELPTDKQLQLFQRRATQLIKAAKHPHDLEGQILVFFENMHGGQTSISTGEFGILLPFKSSVEVSVEKYIADNTGIKTFKTDRYAYSPETGETAFQSQIKDYYGGRWLKSEEEQKRLSALPSYSKNLFDYLSGYITKEELDEETAEYLELLEQQHDFKQVLTKNEINEVNLELLFLEPFNEIEKPSIPEDIMHYIKEMLGHSDA